MRWPVLLLGACGRVGFDETAIADAPAGLQVVQTAAMLATAGDISVPLAPTRAGSLIIVTSGNFGPPSTIASISDDVGNVYVTANALSIATGLDVDEIWYASAAKAGATTVTVHSAAASKREVWLLEVLGASAAPLEIVGVANNAAASTTPSSSPVTPTVVPALIVAVGDFDTGVSGLHAPSAFTALQILAGNDTAYQLVEAPGTYIAVWDDPSLGTYCTSAAAFH